MSYTSYVSGMSGMSGRVLYVRTGHCGHPPDAPMSRISDFVTNSSLWTYDLPACVTGHIGHTGHIPRRPPSGRGSGGVYRTHRTCPRPSGRIGRGRYNGCSKKPTHNVSGGHFNHVNNWGDSPAPVTLPGPLLPVFARVPTVPQLRPRPRRPLQSPACPAPPPVESVERTCQALKAPAASEPHLATLCFFTTLRAGSRHRSAQPSAIRRRSTNVILTSVRPSEASAERPDAKANACFPQPATSVQSPNRPEPCCRHKPPSTVAPDLRK